MKKSKNQPYKEIIYLHEERKEYVRLCNGKSTKYKYFTDWEAHIRERLLLIKDTRELYNFKRYCMNVDRGAQIAPKFFMSFISLLIPLYINVYLDALPGELSIFIMSIALACVIVPVIKFIFKLNQECCLAHDILEIIEKMENEQSETN